MLVQLFFTKRFKSNFHKNHFWELEQFHEDGRVVEIKFHGKDNKDSVFTLLNIYFPNWWTKADGTEMLTYKLEFYENFIQYINNLKANWENIITTWDFNICHHPIDIARPEENKDSIWFLPIERKSWTNYKQTDMWMFFVILIQIWKINILGDLIVHELDQEMFDGDWIISEYQKIFYHWLLVLIIRILWCDLITVQLV